MFFLFEVLFSIDDRVYYSPKFQIRWQKTRHQISIRH